MKFGAQEVANAAMAGLRKRTFGGKYLVLVYFPVEKFDAQDFTDASPSAAPATAAPYQAPLPPQQQSFQERPAADYSLPSGGGGVQGGAPVVASAGRGRSSTMPAWMTAQQGGQ